MKWTTATGVAAVTLLVAACGYTQEERTTGGAAAGAATGAGIGALGGPVGALAGAAIGGAAGGITGATTSPSDINLGQPPWTNPQTELPFDDTRRTAARGSSGGGRSASMRSSSVRQAQMDLQRAGFAPGPIDGVWGSQTARAVREFQQAHNLPQTGRLDSTTMQALHSATGGTATGSGAAGSMGTMGGGSGMTGSMSPSSTPSTGPGGTSDIGSGNQPGTGGTTSTQGR